MMNTKNVFKVTKVSFPAIFNGIKGTAKDITEVTINGKTDATITFYPTNARPFYKKIVAMNEIKI